VTTIILYSRLETEDICHELENPVNHNTCRQLGAFTDTRVLPGDEAVHHNWQFLTLDHPGFSH